MFNGYTKWYNVLKRFYEHFIDFYKTFLSRFFKQVYASPFRCTQNTKKCTWCTQNLIIYQGVLKLVFSFKLRLKTGMSQATLAKLSKGENVTTDVLERICKVIECDIGDILEVDKESK